MQFEQLDCWIYGNEYIPLGITPAKLLINFFKTFEEMDAPKRSIYDMRLVSCCGQGWKETTNTEDFRRIQKVPTNLYSRFDKIDLITILNFT